MTSKTQINKRMNKKTNPALAKAIFIAKKNNLLELAKALSASTRKQKEKNLGEINKAIKESGEDAVIIPGKVLGMGNIKKKMKIYALGFSASARKKLEEAGCELKTILQALWKDNNLKGKILRSIVL